MTNTQLFFSIVGVFVALTTFQATFFKYYLDAKVDPIHAQLRQLIDYMILQQGKISTL